MMDTELELARAYLEFYPEEAALSIERMQRDDVTAFLSEVPVDVAARVIVRMAPNLGADFVRGLPREFVGELLSVMPRDQSAFVLRRMTREERIRSLEAAPPGVSSALSLMLQFPEDTAGALMDPEILSLPEDIDVGEALERVRRSGARIFYYVYVINRSRKLVGVLNLRELIEAPEDRLLEQVMHTHVARLSVHADPVAMRAHPGWYEYSALPVVDDHGVLVGILRYKTLRATEPDDTRTFATSNPLAAGLAMGELYWSTLGQLLQTLWPAATLNSAAKTEKPDGR